MQNYRLKLKTFRDLKLFILNGKEEIAGIVTQIYSKREGSDSPGGFRFKRTRKNNPRTLSKIF